MMLDRKKNILEVWGQEPQTLDELGACTIAVLNTQLAKAKLERHRARVLGLAWDVAHCEVSNSHSAPVGKKTNFAGNKTDETGKPLPRTYPGWAGRIWVRFSGPTERFGSDPFGATLIHTGTGGAGAYNGLWQSIGYHHWQRHKGLSNRDAHYPHPEILSWDTRFFDDDWPGIRCMYEKELIVHILKGSKSTLKMRHSFKWEDPDTAAADARFIEESRKISLTESMT